MNPIYRWFTLAAIGLAVAGCAVSNSSAPNVANGSNSGQTQSPAAISGGPMTGQMNLPAQSVVPLGVNIERNVDYERARMFIDAMKSAWTWGAPAYLRHGSVPVDVNGWPTTDFGVSVIQNLPDADGTYKLSFLGQATIQAKACKDTIANQSYNPSTNITTADIIVPPGEVRMMLSFTNTNGGSKNIHVIRPGYDPNTTELFTSEYLRAIKPFHAIRLVDYLNSNGTPVINWDDRAKPTDAILTTPKGGPIEYIIQLCNETGVDPWINIPTMASDDYVRQLAVLLQATLSPDRHVYLENGNELWNGAYTQAKWNKEQAAAEVAQGNSPLNAEGGDARQWGLRRVSKRLVEEAAIFRSVFGNAAMNTRIRPVLCSHSPEPRVLQSQVDFIGRHYGTPSKLIYGVAGAPYIHLGPAVEARSDLTVDELFNLMNTEMGDEITQMKGFTAIARQYGLKSMSYEGGIHLVGAVSLPNKIAANRDPRMADLVARYLHAWYAQGGDLFMYYNLTSQYNQYGSWGLTEDIRKTSPKVTGVAAIMSQGVR